jgi:hypothetical protein
MKEYLCLKWEGRKLSRDKICPQCCDTLSGKLRKWMKEERDRQKKKDSKKERRKRN